MNEKKKTEPREGRAAGRDGSRLLFLCAAAAALFAVAIACFMIAPAEDCDAALKGVGEKFTHTDGFTYEVISHTGADTANLRVIKPEGGSYADLAGPIVLNGWEDSPAEKYVVAEVGEMTFWDCEKITSVELCGSITTIHKTAFYGCSKLTAVTFAGTSELVTIGDQAFANCAKIAAFDLPASVRTIGKSAFRINTSLVTFAIPDGSLLETIGEYAFANCAKIAAFDLPASVRTIGKSAFLGNASLATFAIPEDSLLETIGAGAFGNSIALASITLPASLVSVESDSFNDCKALSITVHDDNRNYSSKDGALYDKDKTALIFYPPAAAAFTLPNTVRTIGQHAVAYSDLAEVRVPAHVETVSAFAFSRMYNLEVVYMSDSTEFHYRTFKESNKIKVFAVDGSPDELLWFDGTWADLMVVSSAEVSADKRKEGWGYAVVDKYGWGDVRYSVETVGEGRVAKATAVPNVGTAFVWSDGAAEAEKTLEDGMDVTVHFLATTVNLLFEYGGFKYEVVSDAGNKVGLRVITRLPDGPKYSGEATLPSPWNGYRDADTYEFSVTEVGDSAFKNCGDLTSVQIPATVKEIAADAFSGCASLATLGVPADGQLAKIAAGAFKDCAALASITLPAELSDVGNGAFSGCGSLTVSVAQGNASFSVDGDGVLYRTAADAKELVAYPFGSEAASFEVPPEVTAIRPCAFERSKLNEVTISGATEVRGEAFLDSDVKLVRMPGTATVVESSFKGCWIDLVVVDGTEMPNLQQIDNTATIKMVVSSFVYEGLKKENPPASGECGYAAVKAEENGTVAYSVAGGVAKATAETAPDRMALWSDPSITGDVVDLADGMDLTVSFPIARNATLEYPGGSEVVRVPDGIPTVLPAKARTGYLLKGWKAGDVTHLAGAAVTLTADATFVAAWSADPSATEPYAVLSHEDAASVLGTPGIRNPVLDLGAGMAGEDLSAALGAFAGDSVTINLPDGAGTWAFSGAKVADAGTFRAAVSAFAATQEMKDAATWSGNALYLEFAADGKLPFAKSTFTVAKADWMDDGDEYGVHLWNGAEKGFEKVGTATVADGKVTVPLEHCSVYAVAGLVPVEGDNTALYAAVAIAIILVIIAVALFVYPGILRKR